MTSVREGLLGPSYAYHRRLIERSKSWSADEIRRYQQERFRRLIDRYGDQVTSKEDYRRDLGRYTRWDVPALTRTVRTSGSMGQPFSFRADTFARRQKERAYLFDIWSRVGYKPYDLRLGYRDLSEGARLFSFNLLENQRRISINATTKDQIAQVRRWIQKLPPFFLHIYPSTLYAFIDLVGEDLFHHLPIRGILAGSEAFPVGEQERFEGKFGIRVAHWYGHSEYAALAYHCRECRGFHFYPTYGYMELLPAEIVDSWRIVASSFNWAGTQFVRYDTGDLAVPPASGCSADRFPRVGAIMGRSQETFIDNTGERRALFGYVFGDEKSFIWDQIRDLQVTQHSPGTLGMRVVTNPGANRNQIEQFFERRLPMVKLEFDYVEVIERTAAGKRRYFVTDLLMDRIRPPSPRRGRSGEELSHASPGPPGFGRRV